ncbi:DUF58 domain-containing protein [Stieleria sp. TO1_6]|uniref:DUF58 domain-containing protein n=1 Tax=Stieleria tagensis TaxID=2956795 RepID=UPI00209B432C|nr:DUF58 domain-containing protein [Stieleria tagensis]MCO8120156.1 DUF58 domain-containing protein [Stieleria tagensis]
MDSKLPDVDPGREFFDPVLAERLATIPLSARGPMLGTVSGRHQSPHRGSSVEFAQYRRYQPGDDLRRLDWRAYGRSDRFYVKEFEADTNLRLVFVVDASGSMGFGQKLHVARQIVAMLAYLAIGQGDAVGLVAAGESAGRFIPPRRIAGQVTVLFNELQSITADGPTTIETTLHEMAETIRERAMVVVISDLLFQPASLRSGLEHLAFRKHDLALLHLMDPRELRPDWDRPVRLQDLESDESLLVDPDEIAAGYETAVREFIDEIETISRETAVDYHRVMLDQPIEDVLMRLLVRRRDTSP